MFFRLLKIVKDLIAITKLLLCYFVYFLKQLCWANIILLSVIVTKEYSAAHIIEMKCDTVKIFALAQWFSIFYGARGTLSFFFQFVLLSSTVLAFQLLQLLINA